MNGDVPGYRPSWTVTPESDDAGTSGRLLTQPERSRQNPVEDTPFRIRSTWRRLSRETGEKVCFREGFSEARNDPCIDLPTFMNIGADDEANR